MLEGLEPVRRRPGMYIGGTDERALHHLAAEVIDNAMDEAVAGHASRIEVTLEPGNRLTVTDNGRGIPVDPHPKYPGKSALEVILTTLHSGGKFEGKAYATSGGLHGVGVSVVNALSSETVVEVARDKKLYRQTFAKGVALGPLEEVGAAPNRRGTTVSLHPRPRNFRRRGALRPRAAATASPAPRPICSPGSRSAGTATPRCHRRRCPKAPSSSSPAASPTISPNNSATRECVTAQPFAGRQDFPDGQGRGEWAVAWPLWSDGCAHPIIATPSRPPTAAPTRRACAPR